MRRLNGSLSRSVRGSIQDVFQQSPLDLRFALQKTLDPRVTFTRASSGTFVGSDGVLQTAATNEPRFDHNPTTGESLGLLVEEARTNSIRNNTGVGAVSGTPGTLPTNWTQSNNTGLAANVVGTGTENGITYIDLRVNGTTTGTGQTNIVLETSIGVAATTGQTWSLSSYLKIQAGSLTNVSAINLVLQENTAVGTAVTAGAQATTIPTSSLGTYRPTFTRTLSGGVTVAAVMPYIQININTGLVVDFTLRIGLLQLEQGAFATSVIPTTTATATRAADVASITGTNFSSWYNQTEGTVFAEGAVAQPNSGGNQFVFRTSDNGYNNSVALNIQSGGFASIATASGGVFDGVATSSATLIANTTAKFAGAYATNNLGVSLNGATVATDTSATMPTALNRLDIGSDHIGSNRIKAGTIKRLTYWPTRLSTIQQITQP